jgi:hypothetical protein
MARSTMTNTPKDKDHVKWTIEMLGELLYGEKDNPASMEHGYGRALLNAIGWLSGGWAMPDRGE